ncbi:acetyltransferase [Psychrobium sp. 1_MG-2023]|uniref:acetyltransferase n=1 Tax=Psychrobium sp. 1_MG-2023 TaxID=3062624 RepID=UPI000C322F21|nr:acetyltransferase [Psychrobium sp. 1_MG-2023]MDP2559849.1 acetyltransferase [Psychrobium sp. 1_MG-2023]PKF59047.1 shikimate dehydrogenase [Alteromonadales bacterium alter-6D02]
MSKPLVIIGAGGHAKVLMDILSRQGRKVIAYAAPEQATYNTMFTQLSWLRRDKEILKYSTDEIQLVNAIGSMPYQLLRSKLFDMFKQHGYEFASIVCESALISPSVKLGEGVQILSRAVINADTTIAANCIINTGTIIEHDCQIGRHNHCAPSATLCGGVTTADFVHVGTGANIIEQLSIGEGSIIGAGTTITQHVEKNTIVYSAKNHLKKRE